ncbi:GTPase HflX [Enterococcus sp. S86.2]|uniref:GTPase HflX n=1 Tax=Enterococcus sp. S86.2 TaxID=3031299 RepID=UPI0026F11448|nr:GTPase HflX [Enterococcus sp. S86.2]
MEQEKVILVGVETEETWKNFGESMQELKGLTKTAKGEVCFSLIQKRPQVDRQTIIGKGKLTELKNLVGSYEADLVIFNHELTPRQSQTIADFVAVPVIDRVQLILDIFALRARSKAGKLQVELAQLEYLLPRLVGQGKYLSRLGGGIGTRGPGETKLETDRRHIRNKITAIKRELKDVAAHRERTRQRRKNNRFQIGLIGYTNAGKSTIMNVLTEAKTYEQDELFATLDPLTKRWKLPEGFEVTLTDTVGFIQDLPTQLIDAFHSTLEESRDMDLLLHVVDASSPDRTQQEQTVLELMKELDFDKTPILTVYNKADKIDKAQFVPTLFPNVLISAKSSRSKAELTSAVRLQLMENLEPYNVYLKQNEGKLLAQLKSETLLVHEEFLPESEKYLVKGFALPEASVIRRMEDELDR